MSVVTSAFAAHLDAPLGAPLAAIIAAGGVTVDLDRSFLIQAVAFLIVLLALKPMLFDPVLRIFEEREKRTEGARGEARDMQEEAGVLLRKYQREFERVNLVAAEERDRIRAETSKLEAQILDEARAVATRTADEGRTKMNQEVSRIQFDLGKHSADLSRDIASQVLGREVS